MPRTTEQNEKIRTERIEQILAAAIEVYLEKGIRGTEMGDIAKKAGVARGLVYYYYKNKIELFRELFSRYMSTAEEFIKIRLSSDEEIVNKLKNYTRFYLKMAETRPDLVRFYRNIESDLKLVFVDDSEKIMNDYTKNTHEPLFNAFKQAIDEGKFKSTDPKILVTIYFGALTGAIDVFTKGNILPEESDQTINLIIEIIFEGLLN